MAASKKKKSSKKAMTYAGAGVSIATWNVARKRIGELVRQTYNNNVLGRFGQFGGMFSVSFLKDYRKPVLVSSVDGVGTKLKIASEMGIHDTVGQDIVNHCIDDILVMGARPLYFLDYIGTGKLDPSIAEGILSGLSKACKESGCVLIGGETAEMPDIYKGKDYDLAGMIVGVVEEDEVIDGSRIEPGDVLIGLRSNGLHTNGYSLARKIVTKAAAKKYTHIFRPTGRSFGEELLRPHRSYSPVLGLMSRGEIKGCAHITGGGFQDNVDRMLPAGTAAVIDTKSWEPDAIFGWLQKQGNVAKEEMYHTFNMGIGLVLAVSQKDERSVLNSPALRKFSPLTIGRITNGNCEVELEF